MALEQAVRESASAATSDERQPSIAVLPFTNMSADTENEYFSDGLAEEIINVLANMPGLKVAGRTSSFFSGERTSLSKRLARGSTSITFWKEVFARQATGFGSRRSSSRSPMVFISGRNATTANCRISSRFRTRSRTLRPNCDVLEWMGKKPSGSLTYRPDGRMALQIMRDPPSVAGSMWSSDGRILLPGASTNDVRDALSG
jgi:hypothetical protein